MTGHRGVPAPTARSRGRRRGARTRFAVAGLVLVTLAACSGAGTPDPSPVPSAPSTSSHPTSTPSGTPDPVPAESTPPETVSGDGPTLTSGVPSGTSGSPAGPSPGTDRPTTTIGAAPGLPDVGVPGVNDPDCTDDRPPVLLLHGTFSTTASTLAAVAGGLSDSGRCVFALDYGWWGLAPVRESAADVAEAVRLILTTTGFPVVDVVGHSQGALVLRTALRREGLAPVVRTAVLLAPSFHGTALALGDGVPLDLCPACRDQLVGSDLLTELDAGGDLDGQVRYFVLSTEQDTVVVPVESQVPTGPPDRVTATTVESLCPGTVTDHVAMTALPVTIAWVDAAVEHRVVGPGEVTC